MTHGRCFRGIVRYLKLTSLTACALVSAGTVLAASPLPGEWQGQLRCGDESGTFTLHIDDQAGTHFQGELRFQLSGRRSLEGAYRIQGRMQSAGAGSTAPARADRREQRAQATGADVATPDASQPSTFVVTPLEWIRRPTDFDALTLEGSVGESGLRMEGQIRGCRGIRSQGSFSAMRADAEALLAERLQMPPAPLVFGALDGTWTGTLDCSERRSGFSDDLPVRMEINDSGSQLLAMLKIGRPVRDRETREFVLEDEEIILSGSRSDSTRATFTQLGASRNRFLMEDVEAHLDGDQLDLGLRIRFTGCADTARVVKSGPLPQPALAQPGLLRGVLAGYNAERLAHSLGHHFSLEFHEHAGRVFGVLDVVRPVNRPPVEQSRQRAILQPVPGIEDLLFAITDLLGEEASVLRSNQLLSLEATDDDGNRVTAQLLQRGRPATTFSLESQPEATVAALRKGQAPPFGPAMIGLNSGRIMDQVSLDDQCRVVHEWAMPAMDAPPQGRSMQHNLDAVGSLFLDGAFGTTFGQTFAQLNEDTLDAVGRLLDLCDRRLGTRDLAGLQLRRYFIVQGGQRDSLLAHLMNLRDGERWATQTLEEIPNLGVGPGAAARLTAIDNELAARGSEIAQPTRDNLRTAIARQRAEVEADIREQTSRRVLAEAEDIPTWPDVPRTLQRIGQLLASAQNSNLTAAQREQLLGQAQAKAAAITTPMVTAWRQQFQEAGRDLEGLASLRSLEDAISQFNGSVSPALRHDDADTLLVSIRRTRSELVDAPAVRQAFLADLDNMRHSGFPRNDLQRHAARYFREEEFDRVSAHGDFARDLEHRMQALELAAIAVSDRSTSDFPGEPSAEDMLAAVMYPLNEFNRYFRGSADRCQQGLPANNPLMMMNCINVMVVGEVQVRISDFVKLACVRAVGAPGYVCDYGMVIDSNQPLVQVFMRDLLGSSNLQANTSRFLETEAGWELIRSQ